MSFPYVATLGTAVLGSYFTRQGLLDTDWFDRIKPPAMPPRYVFPIAWTILYVLLAMSYAQFRSNVTEPWYMLNLVGNVYWCYAYFYDRDAKAALWIILGLLGIAGTIAYLTQDYSRLVPYMAWLLFATYLTYQSTQKIVGSL